MKRRATLPPWADAAEAYLAIAAKLEARQRWERAREYHDLARSVREQGL